MCVFNKFKVLLLLIWYHSQIRLVFNIMYDYQYVNFIGSVVLILEGVEIGEPESFKSTVVEMVKKLQKKYLPS